MKKRFISVATFCAVLASTSVWVGCSDYDDDIQNLQGQITANATDLSAAIDEKVNALTQEINNLKSQEEALSTALETAKAELNEAIADAKTYADAQAEAARVAAIEAAQAEVKAAREALETSLAEANAKIEGLNTTVNGQAEQIAALLDADKTMEQSIAEANAAIEAANTAIEEVRGLANANSEELTKLNEDLAAVADNLKTVETNLSGQIASLGERVDEAYNQIAANKADAEKQLAQVNSLIKANSDLIAALQEKDEALDAKDAELLADIIENTNGLADLAEKLTAAEELCEQNLVAAKGYTDAQLALLKTSLGLTDETSIDLPAAITRLGAAEEAIAGIKENIAELAEKDEELQGLIDAVEKSVDGIKVQVGSIAEQVNKNTEAIKQNAEAIGANAESIASNAEGIKKLEELTTKLQEDLGKLEASTAENLKAEIEKVMANFENYATTAAMNQLKETLSADYAKADEALATTLRGELAQSVKDLQEQIDAINLSDFQSQIDNLTGKTDEEIKALKDKLADDYDDLKTEIGLIMGESGAIETVNEAIDGVAERVTKLETELPELTKSLTDRIRNVEQNISSIQLELQRRADAAKEVLAGYDNTLGTLFGYTSQLRSIVFKPELYYQGIEAIGVYSYNYNPYKTPDKADVEKDQSNDTPEYIIGHPGISVVPDFQASYYLNPSNAAIDTDVENFVVKNHTAAITRAVGQENIKVKEVEKADGQIKVTFSMTDANAIEKLSNSKVDVMALQYNYKGENGNDTTVISDFAALKQYVITDFKLNKVSAEGNLAEAPHNHLATTAAAAVDDNLNYPYLEIEYTDLDGIDLDKWINVHYKYDGNANDQTWGGQETINEKNFKLEYELIGYKASDTDKTNESKHATIKDNILTVHGVGEEPTENNRKIIGRTPLVRVILRDNNSNQIAAIGYIRVKITDKDAIDLIVKADAITNPYRVLCDDTQVLEETAITWDKIENEVLGALNMSKDEFEASYKPAVDGFGNCKQYDNSGADVETTHFGEIESTHLKDEHSHETMVLRWTISNNEAYQLFAGKQMPVSVSRWVKFEPVTGQGRDIYIQVTWTPSAKFDTPTAAIQNRSAHKKYGDWHKTNSREAGYEELHVQVGAATVPGASCEYEFLVVSNTFNQNPLDIIKSGVNGGGYTDLANNVKVAYKFADNQAKTTYQGADGTSYTVNVTHDAFGQQSMINAGGHTLATIGWNDGTIEVADNDVAKNIINYYTAENGGLANALTLTVKIETTTCPPGEDLIKVAGDEFNVKVIKPIFVENGRVPAMTLNNFETLTQPLSLDFTDFNDYDPQEFWNNSGQSVEFWKFYGVKSIKCTKVSSNYEKGGDSDQSYTQLAADGTGKKWTNDNFSITFTEPTGGIKLNNMGTVKLDQIDMSRSNNFKVRLQLEVEYAWGKLYPVVTFDVNAAPGARTLSL